MLCDKREIQSHLKPPRFQLFFYLFSILIFFLEVDSLDKDQEISQFFLVQISDLFKDTISMFLIKL